MGMSQTGVRGVFVGVLQGVSASGNPIVTWDGSAPLESETIWFSDMPSWEECVGQAVLLGLIDGDDRRPIVLGMLERPRSALASTQVRQVAQQEQDGPLVIRNNEEILLQCGKARISLRADGRIQILGGHLLSRSSGVNKVQGGSVHIN